MSWRKLGHGRRGLLAGLLVMVEAFAEAQVAVPVGSGSYASSIPATFQFSGGYYSMTAQQVVTQFVNLHLSAAVTNRPIPSSRWWTDAMVGDRSYQPAANTPRTIVQDAFGGQLWAYPCVVDSESFGFNLYFPNAWTPSGADPAVPQGPFMTGTALPITGGVPSGGSFAPVKSVVTGWSDWSVDFSLPDAGTNRMDITLARGVPFVWTRCVGVKPRINLGTNTVTYTTNNTVIIRGNGTTFTNSAFAFDYQGRALGVFAPAGTRFLTSGGYIEAQLSGSSNYLVFAALPARTNLTEFAKFAYAQVTNSVYSWTYDITNGHVSTTWKLGISPLDGVQTNTLQGWLPHHWRTTSNDLSFKPYTYLTPRGLMKVASGNQFQLDFAFRGIAPVLPAPQSNSLANNYIANRMTNYISQFSAIHPTTVSDTYGAGKELGISAQNMTFARQLGITNQATKLAVGVKTILTNWFTYTPGEGGQFFARYANWRALIGFPTSYGTEAFNDNHFHYGYFMVACALLGTEDSQFLPQYGPMAKLVAKEYANWDRSETNFPFLRTFDVWEGHSWAGGFSGSGGNNQESSSEAMNGWAGLFLLGAMLEDSAMTAAGAMGFAVESAAVNEYWQDMFRTNFPASYGKGMVGILWSSGLTYGTYFSGDPAWIHGIQWVPANHWNNYLARNKSFANWQLTNLWSERVIASEHGLNGFSLTDSNNAVALGGYLGNYVLGFQTLFDPDGVASIMDSAYATNAAIAKDATYSGVTYYLTHSLRWLGDPAPDYYTSIPTSQVFSNAATGKRTAVIYNPSTSDQTAVIYRLGVPVGQVTAPARKLTVNVSTPTNPPVRVQSSIKRGAKLDWPTTVGTTWTLQSADAAGASVTWNTLLGLTAGDGATNSTFDTLWPEPHRQFQVLEVASNLASIVVNGGFETGSGSVVSNWSVSGTQPPVRVSSDRHAGSYAMQLFVTNTASTPNTSALEQNVAAQGGLPVVGGRNYQFTFWAKRISSGVSYVQNYRLSWLDAAGATISSAGWTGFSASTNWTQVTVPGLVAPSNAVNALIQLYSATGAVLNGFGSVLIDDVSLAYGASIQTNVVAVAIQPGVQISWPSVVGRLYDVCWKEFLSSSNWSNLISSVVGDGTTNTLVDLISTNRTHFYNVLELR